MSISRGVLAFCEDEHEHERSLESSVADEQNRGPGPSRVVSLRGSRESNQTNSKQTRRVRSRSEDGRGTLQLALLLTRAVAMHCLLDLDHICFNFDLSTTLPQFIQPTRMRFLSRVVGKERS